MTKGFSVAAATIVIVGTVVASTYAVEEGHREGQRVMIGEQYDASDVNWETYLDNTKTWTQAEAQCNTATTHLCSQAELCPSGSVAGGTKSGDQWVPVSDSTNTWVAVGNAYPSRTCGTHQQCCGGKPSWGQSGTASYKHYVACCSGAAAEVILPNHIGFEEPQATNPVWEWEPATWRQLKVTSDIECNPASCVNPPSCNIPNCEIVSFDAWAYTDQAQWVGRIGIGVQSQHTSYCNTIEQQMDTSENGCIPASIRHSWPGDDNGEPIQNEGDACRAVLSIITDYKSSRDALLMSSITFLPAARIIFCYANAYFTGYSFVRPKSHVATSTLPNLDWYMTTPAWSYPGNWTLNIRSFLAWPFSTWQLDDGTSTKDIIIHVYKRAVCRPKIGSQAGEQECYSTKFVRCLKLTSHVMTAQYPSDVGSAELKQARSGIDAFCSDSLQQKVGEQIAGYMMGV